MKQQASLIFPPNPTHPLHIGNALVMWLTMREARERECVFSIRWDTNFSLADRAGVDSILESAECLGYNHPTAYYDTCREERYREVIAALVDARVAENYDGTGLPVANHSYGFVCEGRTRNVTATVFSPLYPDAIQGTIGKWDVVVAYNGMPNMSLMNMVDWMDFGTPLHIRGADNMWRVKSELLLAKAMQEVYGDKVVVPQYAHVPMICTTSGRPLHKSTNVPPEYEFNTWAKRFKTPEDVQQALERMILWDDKPYALGNIIAAREISVMPDGRRLKVLELVGGQDVDAGCVYAKPFIGLATI